MPFTPLHFGLGAAINALAPKHISFLSFCAANVLIDIEPLYFMLNAQYPIHRFLHTYLGASTIIIATLALFVLARKLSRWLPNWFAWQSLSPAAVTFGAAAGCYSHVLLDSVMHTDIRPFAPFSDANPLLGIIAIDTLHSLCLVAGIAGLWLWFIRQGLGK
jgi:membrane-bound metal-dependent hydrolase YbcI (DUF457 family)